MRRLLAVALLFGAGCSAYVRPTPEDLQRLRLPEVPASPGTTRYRVHLSIDSRWLAGEFDGVVLVQGGASPLARAQMFGDLGPKVFDLTADRSRIAGYFPQMREGVDCSLPSEAAPHPLLFLGVSLLEDFATIGEDRVLGIREDVGGWWLDLKPLVPGMRSEALHAPDGRTVERRFRWMYGLGWEEHWDSREACTIRASGLVIRVRILGAEPLEQAPPRAYEFAVPDDVRIVEGSRK